MIDGYFKLQDNKSLYLFYIDTNDIVIKLSHADLCQLSWICLTNNTYQLAKDLPLLFDFAIETKHL